ncbi:MAG TPA: asparagine--tRNA ligase, partial [Halanaerobiales bacterium]|nr:asparagine--tRNA ligase [Halanaerobiales bacterium]
VVNRFRSKMSYAVHKYFHNKGFYYIHSPIITTGDAEGAGELFKVTTFDMECLPRDNQGEVDHSQDFFAEEAGLTVSGQLEAELLASALGDVYTFGPTFRAENSNTSRHASEFWMIEPEMAFCELEEMMIIIEELIKYLFEFALAEAQEEMDFFNRWIDKGRVKTLEDIIKADFGHVSYTEAIEILEKASVNFDFPVKWGVDLQSEHERYLTEKYFKKPIMVTDYPKKIKAFYMRLNDDNKTVRAVDCLVPQVGEIIGGSQREERYDVLYSRMKENELNIKKYNWFLDIRQYGSVPHSGFGLGFERLLMYISGINNIRDIIPFPRTPGNARF